MRDPRPSVALLWPSRKVYPWFQAICGSDAPATYDAFLQAAEATLKAIETAGCDYVRIDVVPEAMTRWCLSTHGNLNADSRADYAAFCATLLDRAPAGTA